MDKIEKIEVIEVGDNEESWVIGQKDEESFIDENAEIFDTILLNEIVETPKGKLEVLKDQGSDTCGVFKSLSIFSLLTKPPVSLSLSSGVQTISLSSKESL